LSEPSIQQHALYIIYLKYTQLTHPPQPMQIEANHAKACDFIRLAASQGAHLAVLPEYHLTSWVPSDPAFRTLCAQSQKYLDSYCALAKELNINIVPGTIIERRPDNTLLNIAYFISHTGTILSAYQKKNLWHPERPHLTSSAHEPHEAFDTPLGKVGMLICWDLAFPEAFRELIAAGAKIIIVPTFWGLADCSAAGLAHNPLSEALFLESTLVSRAFENTCAVVFVNAGGPVGGEKTGGSYAGLSQVAVPFKGALGKLGAEEGMSVVEVDMQVLEDAEENYRVREDMGRERWHYAYTLTRDEKSRL
jgi:predicted amidohydrolase